MPDLSPTEMWIFISVIGSFAAALLYGGAARDGQSITSRPYDKAYTDSPGARSDRQA